MLEGAYMTLEEKRKLKYENTPYFRYNNVNPKKDNNGLPIKV